MMSKTENDASPGADRPAGVDEAAQADRASRSAAGAGAGAEARDDWLQIEQFVEQLHEAARAPLTPQDFYRQLLEGCVTLLAAQGAAVWLPAGRGRWQATYRIHGGQAPDGEAPSARAAHVALLQKAAAAAKPLIVPPHSYGPAGQENASDAVLVLAAVRDESDFGRPQSPQAPEGPQAIVELSLQPGSSPAVEQGWQELMLTVCQVASDFHLHEQLRALRTERGFYDQSLALMRRFQQITDLRQMAFEIANEGRRFVAADRLTVLVKQGKRWQLLAASGVDQIEKRSDTAKRLHALAAATADWGEPLDYADTNGGAPIPDAGELPPALAGLVEQHVDQSQARRLVAVPIEFVLPQDPQAALAARAGHPAAVLIAEQFVSDTSEFSGQRVLELAALCEPALRQAKQLDRFPVRHCLRWSDRWARIGEAWGVTKLSVAGAAVATLIAALLLVRCDFEIEAPATLTPLLERDIFATTDGKVVEVRIAHGQQVAAGATLAVLRDPQLLLDTERVQGEIKTTRKRLEAIAAMRTDRKVREEVTYQQLPLSAEAEQLKQRLASLNSQQGILARRRDALTLRSPIAGKVLTLDVQNLLLTRPVERGQVVFTVADTTAGWRLSVDLPQDRIGQVVAAQRKRGTQLPARFRLAGDTEQTYRGHVESISTAAMHDLAGLDQPSPPFEVVVTVDQRAVPNARPGMSAQVRIDCGRRSLGYVWLHDIWETLYSSLVF